MTPLHWQTLLLGGTLLEGTLLEDTLLESTFLEGILLKVTLLEGYPLGGVLSWSGILLERYSPGGVFS